MKLSIPLEREGVVPSQLRTAPTVPLNLLILSEYEQPHVLIHRVLAQTQWRLFSRFSFAEAAKVLETEDIALVLCDSDFPGGDWKTLLAKALLSARPPRVIVFSRIVDVALWAEVLNLGAYDLLSYPFDRVELVRGIGLACDSWVRECRGQQGTHPVPQLQDVSTLSRLSEGSVEAAAAAAAAKSKQRLP
jgi:DNA-binding NtrC family response regulator